MSLGEFSRLATGRAVHSTSSQGGRAVQPVFEWKLQDEKPCFFFDCRPNNKVKKKLNSRLVFTFELNERECSNNQNDASPEAQLEFDPSSHQTPFKHRVPKVILCIIVLLGQVAAYLLDHKHFAGVPPTTLVPRRRIYTKVTNLTTVWSLGNVGITV